MNNILNNWASLLGDRSKGYWIPKDDIERYVNILIKYFGRDYFNINLKTLSHLKYDNEGWLKMLLSNPHECYLFAAIEFCLVLETFDNSIILKDYLLTKLKTKDGRIHPQLFKGNYHELYTAFLFKTNGLEYVPDVPNQNTIYDGVSRSFEGPPWLIECKELLSDHRMLKISNLNIYLTAKLEQYVKRNIIIGKGGNNRPLVSGYFILGDKLNSAKEDLNKHIKFFQRSKEKINPYIENYGSGTICIEDYKDGLFENYKFKISETAIRFKAITNRAEIALSFKGNSKMIMERVIKKSISNKKKQHKGSSIPKKLLSIGITTFAFSRPIQLSMIEAYENRIQQKLGKDTIALFIIRNFLKTSEYKVVIKAIGHKKHQDVIDTLNNLKTNLIKQN